MLDAKTQKRKDENELSHEVIGAAIDVHRELGPGLLESIYEACMSIELHSRGLRHERQRAIPVYYKGIRVDLDYRLDLLVERSVVVEIKAVEAVPGVSAAQLLTYLRLSKCRLGLLINFGRSTLKEGIERVVNGLAD